MKLPVSLLFAAFVTSSCLAGPIDPVKDDLVIRESGKLQKYDASRLEGTNLYAIYYSAHWCPPCRKFTPDLVRLYNRVKPNHPEFELIFVSSDRSEEAMEGYIKETRMKWPAVKFDRSSQLRQFAGKGIPCLVVVDGEGKVLSHSYVDGKYRGPQVVLEDLDKLLKENGASSGGTASTPSNSPSGTSFDSFFNRTGTAGQ